LLKPLGEDVEKGSLKDADINPPRGFRIPLEDFQVLPEESNCYQIRLYSSIVRSPVSPASIVEYGGLGYVIGLVIHLTRKEKNL
jgi:hypothetical protein